ncbi:MAG TPA: HAD-IA family hydrolase [Candidatus Saccharimonadales bacterium]|nr:HAD-IA family hydrolase [Candidatus Saccharimonadales bacterium]
MINGIIFDADGVLVNGDKFSAALARDYDVDHDKEKEFFTGKFQECLIGKADLKESIAPYLPALGWRGTVDELLDYWFKTEHSLNEELVAYIQKLRANGTPVVLATNQEQYRTDYMLEHMGFKDVFDVIYSSAHLGLKKPAIEFFAKIVDEMGLPKDQVLFWDDDQANIDGATTYGIHAEFYHDYPSFLETMKSKYNLPA